MGKLRVKEVKGIPQGHKISHKWNLFLWAVCGQKSKGKRRQDGFPGTID